MKSIAEDAHDIALSFMSALDANDAEAVRAHMAPGATWWVDAGLDRASGTFGSDPGDYRAWPLHGEMDAQLKCDGLMGVRERFPGGVRQIVRRSFAAGRFAVLEVAGGGLYLGERPYRNRYCFVIETGDGLVRSVREYLDTRHAADVFDGRHLDRRSDASHEPGEAIAPHGASGRAALALLDAISQGDQGAFFALFTPDATWWADGGADRRWSDVEGAVDRNPDVLVVGRVLVSQRGERISQLQSAYVDGLRLRAHRLTEDGSGAGLVCVEAIGEGTRRENGRRYQNRYAFVLSVKADGLIEEVREYCDTQHAFDVYGLSL